MAYAIEVHDVSMRFNLAQEKVDSLKEYFVKRLKGQHKIDEFYALRNISLQIEAGDAYAIVGSNGSGKSTLLKIIAGIFRPTEGHVDTRGVIAPMIELGAGFDPDLTARENVFLNGAVLGFERAVMQEHFDSILDFAELWDFVDVPVKNYSSGMQARLGFSIATIVKPDILIVDEILSVGDAHFQDKCQRKMEEMRAGGATLILVSHSIDQVLEVCRHACWIHKGTLMTAGTAEDVCAAYLRNKDL